MHHDDTIIILDYGSQYTQLIARRVREAGVYSEIHPCTLPFHELQAKNPRALILSGGPASVCDPDSPGLDKQILSLNVPILGICYGMQLLANALGGEVVPAQDREYGRAELSLDFRFEVPKSGAGRMGLLDVEGAGEPVEEEGGKGVDIEDGDGELAELRDLQVVREDGKDGAKYKVQRMSPCWMT